MVVVCIISGYYFFCGVIMLLLFAVVSNGTVRGFFCRDRIKVFYPLRLTRRQFDIPYHRIIEVIVGGGSVYDISPLTICYQDNSNKKVKKVVFFYPEQDISTPVFDFMRSKYEIKIIKK